MAVLGGVVSLSGISDAEPDPLLWLLAPSIACLAMSAVVRWTRPAVRRGR
jgi:hypothetical protein